MNSTQHGIQISSIKYSTEEPIAPPSLDFVVFGTLQELANGEGGNDYDSPAAGLFENDEGGPDDDGGNGGDDDDDDNE